MNKDSAENVLVLQGGGRLGAFECGVLKAFIQQKIKIDIIAATSSGAINAAIYAGSKDEKHPEENLEDFWLDLAKNSSNAGRVFKRKIIQKRQNFGNIYLRGIRASPITNLRVKDSPRWTMEYGPIDVEFFPPLRDLIRYDSRDMLKTAEKYINYKRLSPSADQSQNVRILLTAVDVLSGEPLIFDSYKRLITPLELSAASGYQQPVQVREGVYAWEGSLLSNTPLREVMVASPASNKKIFVVENYSRKIEKLPSTTSEIMSRAKDITFSDKSQTLAKISRLTTRHIILIEMLYEVFRKSNKSIISKKKIDYINREHKMLVKYHGAKIESYVSIRGAGRSKPSMMYTDPVMIVKEGIKAGESKTLSLIDEGIIKT